MEKTIKNKFLARLNYFYQELKDGWDGPNSYAIEEKTYKNVQQLINECDEEILNYFILFPAPNGTLCLDFKRKEICCMNIGNEGFSYVALNEDIEINGEKSFQINEALNALKEMCQIYI